MIFHFSVLVDGRDSVSARLARVIVGCLRERMGSEALDFVLKA
jgi:hypothetical protein